MNSLVKTDPIFSQTVDEVKHIDRHLDRAAVEWIITMREGLHLMRTSPDYVHLVRFEDLTSHPDETLSALCAFCELPKDTTFQEYARQTLHPVPTKESFDVHPKIAPLFHDTMREMGYNT